MMRTLYCFCILPILICFNLKSGSFFEDDFLLEEYSIVRGGRPLIEYVKSKYEYTVNGMNCLFYPARKPRRLYIFFNGATKGKYTMWSWFWNTSESWNHTAYLFLKDDSKRWYLGSEQESLVPRYTSVIRYFMKKCHLGCESVYTIGHSMGGYAAIYYALLLGLRGVFAFRAQIDYKSAIQHFTVSKLKNVWEDLDKLITATSSLPLFYIQFGEFLPDKNAATNFIDSLRERQSIFIVQKTLNVNHVGYHPKKEFIERTLRYFEDI